MKTHDTMPGSYGSYRYGGGGASRAIVAPLALLLASSAVACTERQGCASGASEAPRRPVVVEAGPVASRVWPPAAETPWGRDAPRPRPGIRGVVFVADMQVYEARPGEPLRERGPAPYPARLIGEDVHGVLWAKQRGPKGDANIFLLLEDGVWRPVPDDRVTDEARALEKPYVMFDARWDRIVERAGWLSVSRLERAGLVVGEQVWAWSPFGIFYEDQGRVYRVSTGGPPVEIQRWGETDLVVLESGEVMARSRWGNLLRGDATAVKPSGFAPEGGLPAGLALEVEKQPNEVLAPTNGPRFRVRLADPPKGGQDVVVEWVASTVFLIRGREGEALCEPWKVDEGIVGATRATFIHELALGPQGDVWVTSNFGLHHLDLGACRSRWTPWPELDLAPSEESQGAG